MPPSSRTSASHLAPFGTPPAEPFAAYISASAPPNPGPAGWAAILSAPDGGQRVLAGSAVAASSNQMGLWAAYMALCELPADATGVLYIENKYVLDGLTRWRKGWARRRWRKPTGQPILNGAFWRILSAAADARPGIQMAKIKAEGGDACVTLAYQQARAEARMVRAGSKPVGGSGTILDDCAEEDAAENLAWMREGEAEGEAA